MIKSHDYMVIAFMIPVADKSTTETRTRLLEAAAEVFAEQGFHNARTREISQRAEANIAAIHYYFGDKRGLYDAVIRHAFMNLPSLDLTGSGTNHEASAQQQLSAFISSFLTQLLGGQGTALYTKLIAQEISNPTHALDDVIQDGMRPQVEFLIGLVRELLGSSADERSVRRCAGSILGQCLYFYFGRPVILGTGLEPTLGPELIDELTDHVTRFSMAAIRQLRSSGEN